MLQSRTYAVYSIFLFARKIPGKKKNVNQTYDHVPFDSFLVFLDYGVF